MPVPKTTLPVLAMNDDWQEGFAFYTGRWAGEHGLRNAKMVREFYRQQGHATGMFEGEMSSWKASVQTKEPYWRVFLRHPTEPYYTWFDPGTKARWAEPFDPKTATWFEFVEPAT